MKQLNEVDFSFVSPSMKRMLAHIDIVSDKEMMKQIRPCDILVTSFRGGLNFKSVRKNLNQLFMGGPFSSSKIAIDKNTIWGYGVNPQIGAHELAAIDTRTFFKIFNPVCLCRVPELTESQSDNIVNHVTKFSGRPYDTSALFKSAWDRTIRRKILPFFEDLPENELKRFKGGLFCSTLISAAFYLSMKTKFTKHPLDTWPRDFILSPKTIKVCRTI